MLWHLKRFFFSFCPLHMIYATLFQENRYNYCSAKFNSYFSIIPAISRSLSESAKRKEAWKRFEDVYDLHSWKDLWLSVRLQVPVWTTLYTYWIYNNTIIMHTFLCSLLDCCTASADKTPSKKNNKNVFQGEGFQLNKVRFSNGERCRRVEQIQDLRCLHKRSLAKLFQPNH